jgi:hypothetical protein
MQWKEIVIVAVYKGQQKWTSVIIEESHLSFTYKIYSSILWQGLLHMYMKLLGIISVYSDVKVHL